MGTARTVAGRALAWSLSLVLLLSLFANPVVPLTSVSADPMVDTVRFASFNASLNRGNAGDLADDLSTPNNPQAQEIAEIIQRSNPDVLLINEFDYDPTAADLFRDNYLEVSQNGATPIDYPFVYIAPSNTGVPSGFDFDNDGSTTGPGDAYGFGFFPGQFGMVLYSKYPIDTDNVRTFQNFLWKDMPGALLPNDTTIISPTSWYSPAELDVFRLSSKSHWDVPISVNGTTIHTLVSHPTPPAFDDPQDYNKRRNHDEIRFWADYVTPGAGGYIYDDDGETGGLAPGAKFVLMGDQNADPFDGDSTNNAILQLLDNPQINTGVVPASAGGIEQSRLQGQANDTHQGNPAYDTADFGDSSGSPGNLRVDYVLPSVNMGIADTRVFWPEETASYFALVDASDHRLVWVDIAPDNTMTNQVAAGDVAQESAMLWARSDAPGELTFAWSDDPGFQNSIGTATVTVAAPLLPVKTRIDNLQPGTTYYYSATDASNTTRTGSFTTNAQSGERAGLRFGVSGDWRGEFAPYPAIANVVSRNLDFFLLHGDTIYADYQSPTVPYTQAMTLEDFRRKYLEGYGTRRGLNYWGDIRSNVPVYATIDDHEVTNDFAGGALASTDARFTETTGLINDTVLYERGLQAFQEYHPIADEFYGAVGDQRIDNERKLYRYRTFGDDAAIFVLDNRSFRDQQIAPIQNIFDPTEIAQFIQESFDPNRTMLGSAQLTDLLNDLQAAHDAGMNWKFIMVPEPIQNLGLLAAQDRFEGYAYERSVILDYINQNEISNVVFIAADIHGTVINNLTYQLLPNIGPGQPRLPVDTFEVTTGSVAFFEPFGPTAIDLAVAFGVLTPAQGAAYRAAPPDVQEQIFQDTLNASLTTPPFDYDPVGLEGSGLNAELLAGRYTATSTYGWTEFDVNATTQTLLVTTYGIPYYGSEILTSTDVLSRTPEIVSQFKVLPASERRIRDIQGDDHFSPLVGETVTAVRGIVTAIDSGDGFYMQDPDPDNDPATSEGIFVFLDEDPPVQIGDEVAVTGEVSEFGFGDDLTETQIEYLDHVVLSNNNPLPAPMVIGEGGRAYPTEFIYDTDGEQITIGDTNVFTPAVNAIDFKESLEGMLVQVNSAVVVEATNRFGEIGVIPDNGDGSAVFNDNGGILLGANDTNPEIIMIDDSLFFSEPDVNMGATFTAPITGVMDYTFGYFKLFNSNELPPVDGGASDETIAPAGEDELLVATYNVFNLDPEDTRFGQFAALAEDIVTNLQAPDIIAVQEIQDNSGGDNDGITDASDTYQALVDAIAAAGGPDYTFFDIPPVDLRDGGAPGSNIRVGYLYNPQRVTFNARGTPSQTAAVQVENPGPGPRLSTNPGRIVDPAFEDEENGGPEGFEGTRKPLVAEFLFNGNPVFVINNHLKSKSGDDSLFGLNQPPRTPTDVQRIAQATVVNGFVQDILAEDSNANIVVLGDMNDFQFSDALAALAGNQLTNLASTLPVSDVYSFVFNGNSQALDHILVSDALLDKTEGNYVHTNMPLNWDASASDHDPIVARITLPPPALSIEPNTAPPIIVGQEVSFTLALTPSVPFNLISVDFGDGSPVFETGTTSVNPTHVYNSSGTYTVTASMTDIYGQAVATATTSVELLPPPELTITPADAEVIVNTPVAFTLALTPSNAPFNSIRVDFDDGTVINTPGLTPTLVHTYTQEGVYSPTATLLVGPDNTAIATGTTSITVRVPPVEPEPTTLELVALPASIEADGSSTATLTATVRDQNDNPLPDAAVTFATTLGTLSTESATTNAQGIATAILTAGTVSGTATLIASIADLEATATVVFTSEPVQPPPEEPAELHLVVDDASIAADETTVMTATVLDADSAPLAGITVDFGLVASSGTLTPQMGTTDTAGNVAVTLTPSESGLVYVRAETGMLSDTVSVLVVPAGSDPVEPIGETTNQALSQTMTTTVTLPTPQGSNFASGSRLDVPAGVAVGAVSLLFQEIAAPTRDLAALLNPTDNMTRTAVAAFIIRLVDADGNAITGALDTPITLTVVYADLPAGFLEETIKLFAYDEDSGTWTQANLTVVSVDPATNTVVFSIASLTEFAITADDQMPTPAQGFEVYLPIIIKA